MKNENFKVKYEIKQKNKELNEQNKKKQNDDIENKKNNSERSVYKKNYSLNNTNNNPSSPPPTTINHKNKQNIIKSKNFLSEKMDLIKQEFDEKLNKESLFHVNHSNDIVNPLSVEYTDSISLDNLILKQEMPTQKESDTSLSTSNQTLISPFIKLSTSDNMDLSFSSVETHSPSELPFDTQKTIQLFHSEYHKTLKMSENILQENFEKIYQNASNDKTIDWEFFRLIISNYKFVTETHHEELSNIISTGIPPILRGILWQTITSSKNSDMEHIYRTLINQTAPNEKIIRRDLHRTFPKAILKAMEQYSYNI